MAENKNEKIEINNKILEFGVLTDEKGYQLYLYPGMTVSEIAYCYMVTVRILLHDNFIKSKEEFDKLVIKYFEDPQYKPLEEAKDDSNSKV